MIVEKITSFDGEFAFLSNIYPSEFIDKGISFPTVEHYFQAMKSDSAFDCLKIAAAASPGQAKRLGRHCLLRKDWEDVKNSIMEQGLRLKFEDPELRQKLIDTHPAELVEGNWWGDTCWGVCNGVGENRLGKLLMKLRDEYRAEQEKNGDQFNK